MGVALQSDKNNVYTTVLGGSYPSLVKKLVDIWLFGGSSAASLKGIVNGQVGLFGGAPSFGAGYAQLQGNTAWFDTGAAQALGPYAHIYVGEIPDNTQFCGTYATAGGSATFDNLSRSAGSGLNVGVKGINRISLTAAGYAGFRLAAGSWDGHGVIPYLSSGAVLVDGANGIYEGDNVSPSTLKVAGRSGGAAQKVALFAPCFQVPTRNEMQEFWLWAKPLCEARGIVFG